MKTSSLTRLSSGFVFLASLFFATAMPHSANAGEADLIIPSLDRPIALGLSGQMMLMAGVAISVMGLAFGIWIFAHLKSLPVHKSMLEVSDLIYETCKTYLKTQGKFILLLWVFIATVVAVYFGKLALYRDPVTQVETHGFPLSLVGIYYFRWSALRGVMRLRGSAFESTRSRIREQPSQVWLANHINVMRFHYRLV
jgi:hypothetical protein